jgi:hypothetical protein
MMVLWVRLWFAVRDLENRVRELLLEVVVEIPLLIMTLCSRDSRFDPPQNTPFTPINQLPLYGEKSLGLKEVKRAA